MTATRSKNSSAINMTSTKKVGTLYINGSKKNRRTQIRNEFLKQNELKQQKCLQEEFEVLSTLKKNTTQLSRLKHRIAVRGYFYKTFYPYYHDYIKYIETLTHGYKRNMEISKLTYELDSWTFSVNLSKEYAEWPLKN